MLHPIIKTIAASIQDAARHSDLSLAEAMERFSIPRDLALLGFTHAGVRPRPALIKRADWNA
ncbi:MAG: hypothetical protein ABJO30_05450 [Hyphomicrobiales bacterium]